MTFENMLECSAAALKEHYRSVRALFANAVALRKKGGTGYLLRQVEMTEKAADRRGISLT